MPYVEADARDPETVLVAVHVFTTEPFDPGAVRARVAVEVRGHRVVIAHSADGEDHVVQLYRPAPLHVQLGAHAIDGTYRYVRSSAAGVWTVPAP